MADDATLPVPTDPWEMQRVMHTRLAKRITIGGHTLDVSGRVSKHLGSVRADAIGCPDLTRNPLVSAARALTTLYDPIAEDPDGGAPGLSNRLDPAAAVLAAELIGASGLWPAMQTTQMYTHALREMVVRADAIPVRDGDRSVGAELNYRSITPDLIEAVPMPRDPTRPMEVRELRQRQWGGGVEWTRELWSLSSPTDQGKPVHRILDVGGHDISERYGLPHGGLMGDKYPCLRQDGRPVLPYVVYHAALGTGCLWDAWSNLSLVEGTLQVSLMWTLFGHLLRHASWAQRWAMGVMVEGATAEGADGGTRQAVTVDPSTVLLLRADPDHQGQSTAGQWAPPGSPKEFAESVDIYEDGLFAREGLSNADVQRIRADPRSGVAMTMDNSAQEASALRFHPTFARSDAELVATSSVLVNRAMALPVLPEDGWSVEHALIRVIRQRAEKAQPATGADGVAKVADTALNGAQVTSASAIVAAVANGEIPRDSGVSQLVEFFQLESGAAERIMGTAGTDRFTPRAKAA